MKFTNKLSPAVMLLLLSSEKSNATQAVHMQNLEQSVTNTLAEHKNEVHADLAKDPKKNEANHHNKAKHHGHHHKKAAKHH
jgi:hypothetical protein